MAKMVQIRNVPDAVHRVLKARAAEAGMTLSDYLLREAKRLASRPTMAEVLRRLDERDAIETKEDCVAALRAERKAND